MTLDLSGFRDPKLGRELIECINALAPAAVQRCGGQVNLMEVCGTHTVTIARNGFRSILPEGVNLVSGPGCVVDQRRGRVAFADSQGLAFQGFLRAVSGEVPQCH